MPQASRSLPMDCGRCFQALSGLSTRSSLLPVVRHHLHGAPQRICTARTSHAHRAPVTVPINQGRNHATHRCGNHHPLPPGRRRRVRLRLPGRRGPQHLRRAVQAGQGQARAGPPRAGRGPRGGRLLAIVAQGRRGARHLRPRRHQRGDRHRDRVHGFHPDGGDHRPGPDPRHRAGRVPGVRHRRHHAPVRQAQLPREGREGPRAHDQEGVLPRRHRPPGPGAGRHPEGRHAGHHRVQLSEDGLAALVQPGDQGPRGADQEGGAAPARGQAADGLRGRRRDPQQRVAATDAPRAPAGLSRAPTR